MNPDNVQTFSNTISQITFWRYFSVYPHCDITRNSFLKYFFQPKSKTCGTTFESFCLLLGAELVKLHASSFQDYSHNYYIGIKIYQWRLFVYDAVSVYVALTS